jgi:hypothetical protein
MLSWVVIVSPHPRQTPASAAFRNLPLPPRLPRRRVSTRPKALSFPLRRTTGHESRITNRSLFFSSSFPSCPFRTLVSHLKTTVSFNPFEIMRFRTLCKIPGIGYPPHQSRWCPVALQQKHFYLISLHAVTDSFFHNERGTPPPFKDRGPK